MPGESLKSRRAVGTRTVVVASEPAGRAGGTQFLENERV